MDKKISNSSKYMEEALSEALKTKGFHLPNPFVGSIIVKNDQIIGRGFHSQFGNKHAEIWAIKDAKKNGYDLEGSDIYVTLSPCNTHGRTGACIDAIKKVKIKRVFFGSYDPLQKPYKKVYEGIEIMGGILEEKTDWLNRSFLFNSKYKKPYVAMKLAITLDGYYATSTNHSKWITSEKTRQISRTERSNYQAILVGKNTVIEDNPSLLSPSGFMSPTAVILGVRNLDFNKLKLFKQNNEKIIFGNGALKLHTIKHTHYINMSTNDFSPKIILENLWNLGIKSILIEGGSVTQSKFLKQGLVNEIHINYGNKILGDPEAKKGLFFQSNVKEISQSLELELKECKVIENQITSKWKVKNVHGDY